MSDQKSIGNPAVVGLAGFGITTILLQIHNLGWCGTGVVFSLAIVLGGTAQLIAGLQEQKVGNNFGYSAFTVYGAFWVALGIVWILVDFFKDSPHLSVSKTDIGWFLFVFTIYTAIMWVGSLRIHKAMAITFTLLLIGFIGLDLVFLCGMKSLLKPTAVELIFCAGGALYMMAAAIWAQCWGREVLPLGKPFLSDK